MPSSTARALELLELLQSSGLRTVDELARRLEVDERTVRRHVERLREIGVPVEGVRGRHGGYRIAPGHRMPPLMLTGDEAIAALTGLTGAPGTAAATAVAKLRRSLPVGLAGRAEALLDVAVVDAGAPADPVDPEVLLTAAEAVRERRPVALVHAGADRVTRRSLQPHDLVRRSGRWYLTGLDSASHERRTFRLDRVRSLRLLGGTFPAPPPHDAQADLVSGFAAADRRWRVTLRIRAAPTRIAPVLPGSVARLTALPPGPDGDPWTRADIQAESLDWLPRVLLALDAPVVVDEPDELRIELRRAADRLLDMASESRFQSLRDG